MHRPGRAGGRGAEGLPHHVGNARNVVDGGVHLRHRLERRHVVDFLIDLAEFRFRIAPAGKSDHRRMREISVAQAGGEIERADHLRHADARLARRARVAVGHVGGGFLAVAMHARDCGAPFHLGEGAPQHRRHHEHVGDAVARQHVGQHFGAGALDVVAGRRHQAASGDEFHRHAVDAVAQAGRRRAVVEHVAEMAAAAAAMHLVARHAMAGVGVALDRARQRIVEARPAGAALEFLLGDEQRLVAGRADKGAVPLSRN